MTRNNYTTPGAVFRSTLYYPIRVQDEPVYLAGSDGIRLHKNNNVDEKHHHEEHKQPEEVPKIDSITADADENDSVLPPEGLDLSFMKANILFDRTHEIKKLNECFHRILSPFSPVELILISGKSGTGKTVLANKLQEQLLLKTADGMNHGAGYFIQGKFDQLQKTRPYSAFASAFAEFVQLVTERGGKKMEGLKKLICKSIKLDKQLLVSVFPTLQSIVVNKSNSLQQSVERGNSTVENCDIMDAEVQKRLEIVVRKFFSAVCSIDAPLVLVIDDLQWADSGSLDLLKALLCNKKVQGLVVVGICRSNEVSLGHKFSSILRQIEDERKALISNIVVKDLSWDSAHDMISHMLNSKNNKEACEHVTEILYKKTEGNVYFLVQLLQLYYNDGVLLYDEKECRWVWDEVKLRISEGGVGNDTLVGLFLGRIMEITDDETKIVLMTAACLGADIKLELLSIILSDNIDVKRALRIAEEKEIIKLDNCLSRYTFVHDNIQQATYSMITEEEKPFFHVTIGRKLWQNLAKEKMAEYIFIIVDQIIRGASCLDDQIEKNNFAALCFEAGQRSMQLGSYSTAATYLWQGIDLLEGKGRNWRDQYFLSLELFCAAAEVEYCVDNFGRMNKAINEVLTFARVPTDKIRAYSTLVYYLWSRGNTKEAIDLGINTLKQFGVTFPTKIRKIYVIKELMKTKYMLSMRNGGDISELLSAPCMEDTNMIAAMELMNHLLHYIWRAKPDLFTIIITRFVQLSLKYGLCNISPLGFCFYSGILLQLGDFKNAFKYAKLSLLLLDRFQSECSKWASRAQTMIYALVSPFQKPWRLLQQPLLDVQHRGMERGDFEYSMTAARAYCLLSFLTGNIQLPRFAAQLKEYKEIMTSYHQHRFLIATELQLDMVNVFKGDENNSEPGCSLSIAPKSEEQIYVVQYEFWQLVLAYYFGEIKDAIFLISQSQELKTNSGLFGTVYTIARHFYIGLVSLEAVAMDIVPRRNGESSMPTTKKEKRIQKKNHSLWLQDARKAVKQLTKYSDISPHSCLNKIMLLEAEFLAVTFIKKLKYRKAHDLEFILGKYNQSIMHASEEGFMHEEALANERASLFLMRSCRQHEKQKTYFERAIKMYKRWGANRKVQFMLNCNGLLQ